jgi:hypothetical protein
MYIYIYICIYVWLCLSLVIISLELNTEKFRLALFEPWPHSGPGHIWACLLFRVEKENLPIACTIKTFLLVQELGQSRYKKRTFFLLLYKRNRNTLLLFVQQIHSFLPVQELGQSQYKKRTFFLLYKGKPFLLLVQQEHYLLVQEL